MRRTREYLKFDSSDSSDDEPLIKKIAKPMVSQRKTPSKNKSVSEQRTSSSESDIGDYLQDPNKIDLNSSFFSEANRNSGIINKTEEGVSSVVTKSSDSDSDDEMQNAKENSEIQIERKEEEASCSQLQASNLIAKQTFQQLQLYTKQLEEAKKQVEKYQAKKESGKNEKSELKETLEIPDILAAEKTTSKSSPLHSSDFYSDSEKEDWEEVNVRGSQNAKEITYIPKEGVQITIELPNVVRKKKRVDLLTVMKRRLNRIKKENQVYIHKVHVLCWIAHGNFVNNVINNDKILGLALSLLPSQNSYPTNRIDLSYLEQILQWYKKTIPVIEKSLPRHPKLLNLLEQQIQQKKAFNKKMQIYIFIALLRSLGIQCRLVLSFQVEPLRPPANELHSLSSTHDNQNKQERTKTSTKESAVRDKKLDSKKESMTVKSPKCKKAHEVSSEQKSHLEYPCKTKRNDKSSIKKSSNIRSSKVNESVVEEKVTERGNISSLPNRVTRNNSHTPTFENLRNKKNRNTTSVNENKVSQNARNKEKNKKVKQVDGCFDSQSEFSSDESYVDYKSTDSIANDKYPVFNYNFFNITKVPQLDGADDNKNTAKKSSRLSNLKKLKHTVNMETNKIESSSSIKSMKSLDSDVSKNTSSKTSSRSSNLKKLKQTVHVEPDKTESSSSIKSKKSIIQGTDSDGSKNTSKTSSRPSNLKKLKQTVHAETDKTKSCRSTKSNKNIRETDSEEEFTNSIKNSNQVKSKEQTRIRVNASKKATKTVEKSCKYFSSLESPSIVDVRGDIMKLVKNRVKEEKRKPLKHKQRHIDTDDDSDYVPETVKKKHHDSGDEFVPKLKVKKRISVKKSEGRLVLSSDEETSKGKKKAGIDLWAEVFVEDEEKWISVDVTRGEVHCVQQLFSRATHPVSYIVAWNNDNTLKDVTVRYCNNFNTITRKLRVDNEWWQQTLKPFIGKKTARDREEDDELARQQLEKPLPASLTEYKNHPLYVLERHLLKFQAIYPPDALPLGFVKREPVYSRDCVYTLHSREIWLKQAKVVKPGEKPYKIVKARPKYDKLSDSMISNQMLEVFGSWQTEDYDPPTAENGIVPRNAYGNVELFKSCMLPKKTAHLRLPGLNKIAKKLNIDCAAAIVGFDFHSGWSHPVYDGFVVCEEFADQLVAAWELEQEEIEKKEQEKVEKRVYDNWKKLIKGLLIRERLKAKYDFGCGSSKVGNKKVKGPGTSRRKKRRISSSSNSDSDFNH